MIKLLSRQAARGDGGLKDATSASNLGEHGDGLPSAAAEDLAQVFKLLADASRLRILHALTLQPELHVRAICELLGQNQPAVSHHLGLMKDAGLIESRRQGRHNFYRLQRERFESLLAMMQGASLPVSDRP